MKIAVVLNTSWNIYNFRLNFIKSFIQDGHQVHTIAPYDKFSCQLEEAGATHHHVKMDSRGVDPVRDIALLFELVNIYTRVKPDIIFHFTIKPNVYGTLAASLLGIPSINNVCGLGTVFLNKGFVPQVAVLLYRLSFRFSRKVFFQNPDDLELFVNRGLVSESVANLLPGSGIDLQKFRPAPYQRNQTFTFLLIARLIIDKGVHEYVDAARKLKSTGMPFRFLVLGPKDPGHRRGIQLDTIVEWITSGTIEYLGATNDVVPYINQADCIVLPSYREGTPRVLLEAACLAKPIITTDVPGCRHVVEHGVNGLLCEMRNSDDLAEKMLQMASFTEKTTREFGMNGRNKVVKEFSEQIVIQKYKDAMETIGAKEFRCREVETI